jgi:hypothetical protein
MELEPVTSSNVEAIGYDAGTRTLRVKFRSGGTYDYGECGRETWERLKAAESKGKFIAALQGRKVSPEVEGSRELQSFAEDECCNPRLMRALKSGKLDKADTWTCPACGTEWKPEQHGPVKHWKPVNWMELL